MRTWVPIHAQFIYWALQVQVVFHLTRSGSHQINRHHRREGFFFNCKMGEVAGNLINGQKSSLVKRLWPRASFDGSAGSAFCLDCSPSLNFAARFLILCKLYSSSVKHWNLRARPIGKLVGLSAETGLVIVLSSGTEAAPQGLQHKWGRLGLAAFHAQVLAGVSVFVTVRAQLTLQPKGRVPWIPRLGGPHALSCLVGQNDKSENN